LSAWDVMGMACCTQWTVEKRIQRFGRNTWRSYLEDVDIDGRIILKRA
jgi:hypothetical protein